MSGAFYDSDDYWDAVADAKRERYREKALYRFHTLGPEWHEDWMDEEDGDDDDDESEDDDDE